MKKIISFVLFLVLLTGCASPALTESASVEETDIPIIETTIPTTLPLKQLSVCYSAASSTQVAIWYGYENGIFEKYGLELELSLISGGSKAVSALLAGDVDICQVGTSPVVNAVAAQQDVVTIAGLMNYYPGVLYAKPEIKTIEDLMGKTIAVAPAGGANYVATNMVLQQLGIIFGEDITTLEIGTDTERFAALEAGQADASLLFPPATLKAKENGYVKLYDLTETKLPYQFLGIATSRALIEEDRAVVDAFLRAMIESIALIKNDPTGTQAVLAKYLELDPVKDVIDLEESYRVIVTNTIESKPYPTFASIQAVIDALISENPDVANVTPESILDLSILKEIEASGFFETLP